MTQTIAQVQDIPQASGSLFKELPSPLPAGERVIWQGKPSVTGLALRAFHIREVAIYFGLVLAWRAASNAAAGMSAPDALVAASWLVVPASAGVAILTGLAWAFARAACYTITNRRVLFQFGVALPMTMNIPLDKIATAALKTFRDGSGDIPLTLTDNRASFLLLWPHVRPWRLRAAQPMLRAVPDAAIVAARLADALAGAVGASAVTPTSVANPARASVAMPNATPAAA